MLSEALDRTLLLMRDELSASATDELLLGALTQTTIALVADRENLKSHSAQTAYITTALLMARSGHRVHLVGPNVALADVQPPLGVGMLIDQLEHVGRDLLPGVSFVVGAPAETADLAILLGNTNWNGSAKTVIRIDATAWRARLVHVAQGRAWSGTSWPFGGMAAAALAAAEAFKAAMIRLTPYAKHKDWFAELFAPSAGAFLDLAPVGTPEVSNLGQFDVISGGAISNGLLYALFRAPNVTGRARIIEPDVTEISNLNRGMLFVRSRLGHAKASELSRHSPSALRMRPLLHRFETQTLERIGSLADNVLIGVDDIPSRWAVQRGWPLWLGVGATTHFSAMASFHTHKLPCAGCLHHLDEPDAGRIPTVAFVSFWAGLWLASLFIRHLSGHDPTAADQQVYFSNLRPESFWLSPVKRRSDCPVSCTDSDRPRSRQPILSHTEQPR
jgi:hypothetical protein